MKIRVDLTINSDTLPDREFVTPLPVVDAPHIDRAGLEEVIRHQLAGAAKRIIRGLDIVFPK